MPASVQAISWKAAVLTAFASCLASIASAQTGPLRLGVLTDMSSLYADNGGTGSVVAAEMAVADFGGTVLGRKIEIVSGDHQNKADIGSTITRRWIDIEGVEAVLDVPNSAVALAVQGITRDKKKVFLATGAATSRLTGDECSQTGFIGPTIPTRFRRGRPGQSAS